MNNAMRIELELKGANGHHFIYTHVAKKIETSLKHVRDNVREVVVRLSEVDGPQGFLDKRCEIVINGGGIGATTVEERHRSLFSAIDLAMSKIVTTVNRTIERRGKAERRRRPS
jgi:ribosome-associated translation inhibitor RaiA